jgi:hypothetical protein
MKKSYIYIYIYRKGMETNETNKGKYSKTHFFKTKRKLKRRNKIESKQKRFFVF